LKPLIGITIGDFNGVGPEVALKAAINPAIRKICIPVLIGPIGIFEHTAGFLKIKLKLSRTNIPILQHSTIPVIDVGDGIKADIQPGIPTKSSGRTAGAALERAVDLCMSEKIRAMVTAPVSKEALNLGGYNFPGQTEMIALLSHSQQVVMMLVSEIMKVGLVTIHTGIKNIASQISKEKVIDKVSIIEASLRKDFKIDKPRLAVLGLNPHCGENGLIGDEEKEMIIPAIKEIKIKNIQAEGPFPADAFFGNHSYKNFDAIVAMYHDQGLIPLKMSSFGKSVNFSAGLGLVRTSPDHGTAYDIAWQGKADLSSMLEAVKMAAKISGNRHTND
jgi:4-hydroxythreonine-4-phosphate dehydrogenase